MSAFLAYYYFLEKVENGREGREGERNGPYNIILK